MPVGRELTSVPRTDGAYVGDGHVVQFGGASATLDGAPATWSIDGEILRLTTAAWDAEGRVGLDELCLIAAPAGNHRGQTEWLLTFEASAEAGGA